MEKLIGQGRAAIKLIVDQETFIENTVGGLSLNDAEFGPGAVIGTAMLNNEPCTVIANDALKKNRKFRVVYAGIIGMEEAYKMSLAVYHSIKVDKGKSRNEKRPIILVVDTPGNGPGKLEEIFGMNKATGAYQLALAEARKKGHPVVAVIIGRAISGGFLCHGLQADHILSLSPNFGTLVHVMPLTSIARVTKLDLEWLQELAVDDPVFAAGPDHFYRLGGIEELIEKIENVRDSIIRHVGEIRRKKVANRWDDLGPWGRGLLGAVRGGRKTRMKVIRVMDEEFAQVADKYV